MALGLLNNLSIGKISIIAVLPPSVEGNYIVKDEAGSYFIVGSVTGSAGFVVLDELVEPTDYLAYYKMDDNAASTTVVDQSGSYNGTSNRDTNLMSTTGTKELINTALDFNETNDYVTLPNNIRDLLMSGSLPYSLSIWTKAESYDYNTIFGCRFANNGLDVYVSSSFLLVDSYNDSGNTSFSYNNENYKNWNLINLVNDGTNLKLYVNSSYVTEGLSRAYTFNNSLEDIALLGAIHVPTPSYDYQNFLDGKLDNIRVYDRELTGPEILLLYSLDVPSIDNVLAYYPFTSGSLLDESGNSLNANNNGAVSTTDRLGKTGSAYEFDASQVDYMNITDSGSIIRNQFTIGGWCYYDPTGQASTTDGGIVGKYYGIGGTNHRSWWIISVDLNSLSVGLSTDGTSGNSFNLTTSNISSSFHNKWTHIMGVYDNEYLKLYLDGSEFTSSYIGAKNIYTSSQDIWIGTLHTPLTTTCWNGKLDDMRVYSRALSSAEISSIYDSEKPGIDDVLLYYSFNSGSVNDESGNGFEATNYGAVSTTDFKNNASGAMNFANTSDYIEVASYDSLILTGNITYTGFYKPVSSSNLEIIATCDAPGESLITNTVFQIRRVDKEIVIVHEYGVGGDNEVLNTGIILESNTFSHVGITRNTTNKYYNTYINGDLKTSSYYTNNPEIASSGNLQTWKIGQDTYAMTGIYENVRIYNRELSADEIWTLYDAGKQTFPTDMVAYYPYTSGSLIDQSWHGSNIVNSTATPTIDALENPSSSFYFSGSSYMDVNGSGSVNLNNFAYSLWFNTTDITHNQVLINKNLDSSNTGWSVWLKHPSDTYTNKMSIKAGVTDTIGDWNNSLTSFTASQDTWNHYVFMKDDTTISHYLNSVLIDSITTGSMSSFVDSGSAKLRIGNYENENAGYGFEGRIDNVRVYDRPLSQNEITQIFDEEKVICNSFHSLEIDPSISQSVSPTSSISSMSAYFPFDGNTNDSSGNGNNFDFTPSVSYVTDQLGNTSSAVYLDTGSKQMYHNSSLGLDYKNFSLCMWYKSYETASLAYRVMSSEQSDTNKNLTLLQCNNINNNWRFSVFDSSSNEAKVTMSFDNGGGDIDNEWHFLACGYNGSVINIVVDGDYEEETVTLPETALQIDNFGFNPYTFFEQNSKAINNYRIYDRAITQAEMLEIYNSESVPLADDSGSGFEILDVAAYFPFNGNANDESGNGYTPVSNSAVLTTDRFGNSNSAYSFNGVNQKIEYGNILEFATSSFSMISWIRTTSTASLGCIMSNRLQQTEYTGYYLYLFTGMEVPITTINTQNSVIDRSIAATSAIPVNDGVWHQIVSTVDRSGDLSIYVDGDFKVSLDISSYAGESLSNTGSFSIGYNNPLGPHYFEGDIDDIKLYNKALTSVEVSALYSLDKQPMITSDYVAYFPFNGNANDESGNGLTSVVNGANLVNDRYEYTSSAYEFGGTKSIIVSQSSLGDEYSISCWFNKSDNSDGLVINKRDQSSGQGAEWQLYFYAPEGEYLTFAAWTPLSVTSSFSTTVHTGSINTWYHATATNDSNRIKLYIDGQLESTVCFTGSRHTGSTITAIGVPGWDQGNTSLAFNGVIDDIRIYSRSLSQEEVTKIYDDEKVKCNRLNPIIIS